MPQVKTNRQPTYPIAPWILERWSPRAMTGEEMSDQELLPLFEAARWAPSSYNNQPWRFLYAKRNTPHWQTFLNLLVPFNQSWAQQAACLVVILSKKTFDHNGKPARTHSFDTGAAWMNLALQGASDHYVIHGMEGFDADKARKDLHVPDDHHIEAMVAIGKPAPKETLSEALQAKELPSPRRPLIEIIKEGLFS